MPAPRQSHKEVLQEKAQKASEKARTATKKEEALAQAQAIQTHSAEDAPTLGTVPGQVNTVSKLEVNSSTPNVLRLTDSPPFFSSKPHILCSHTTADNSVTRGSNLNVLDISQPRSSGSMEVERTCKSLLTPAHAAAELTDRVGPASPNYNLR